MKHITEELQNLLHLIFLFIDILFFTSCRLAAIGHNSQALCLIFDFENEFSELDTAAIRFHIEQTSLFSIRKVRTIEWLRLRREHLIAV